MRFWKSREFGTAVVLVAMLLGCELATRANLGESFLVEGWGPSGRFLRIFEDAAPIGLAAIGACLVILSGGVDLSAGSVMGLASVALATAVGREGWAPALGLLAAFAAGTAAGSVNGALVGYLRLPPFIATLGLMSVARGVSYWLSPQRIPVETASPLFSMLGSHSVWALAGATALGSLLLARTSGGRYVYAIGGNEEAARFSGLPIPAIKTAIYATAGLCASLGGCALALRYGSGYVELGRGYELQIIAACAVGGVSFSGGEGSILGAVLGAITLQVLEILLITLKVQADYIQIAYGAAIILAVAVDQLRHGSVVGRWIGRLRRKTA